MHGDSYGKHDHNRRSDPAGFVRPKQADEEPSVSCVSHFEGQSGGKALCDGSDSRKRSH